MTRSQGKTKPGPPKKNIPKDIQDIIDKKAAQRAASKIKEASNKKSNYQKVLDMKKNKRNAMDPIAAKKKAVVEKMRAAKE